MKHIISLVTCCLLCLVLVSYRISYSGIREEKPLMLTTWDAFGYYMYLPALLIYHDCTELKWLGPADDKYKMTGGTGWPAGKQENGKYVFKYLGGVAVLELPWFAIGHVAAGATGAPQDGFSPPYQYALGFGILVYGIIALFLLRRFLLRYFSDATVAITLVLLLLATNYIQYGVIDNAQSHGPIFILYVLILFATARWHRKPSAAAAAAIGYITGLATMSRPTEAIMLFIPLMWETHNREAAQRKWQQVKQHRAHIAIAAFCGLLAVLPQLLYWKAVTGSFLYDVGSKWDFANPHWRVLFGWEKGWFIYTPVTVLFIAGMFFIRRYQFQRSVLWFCLLNIYIIIAWSVWRYGGSYSTRALVQSYPIFALPLAAVTERIGRQRWKYAFYAVCAYLVGVNLFQLHQYNTTVLHYDDMNRRYYAAIYLNPHPTALDMSLLDTDERLCNEKGFVTSVLYSSGAATTVAFDAWATRPVAEVPLPPASFKEQWLRVDADIQAPGCLWLSYLEAEIKGRDSVKHARVRLFSPISREQAANHYAFDMKLLPGMDSGTVKVYLSSQLNFKGTVKRMDISRLAR